MTIKDQHITMAQGESKNIQVPITKAGAPSNVSTATEIVWWVFKKKSDDTAVLSKALGSGITIIDIVDTNDGLLIAIAPDDTRTLAPITYCHECRITDDENNEIIAFEGEFELEASPTAGS